MATKYSHVSKQQRHQRYSSDNDDERRRRRERLYSEMVLGQCSRVPFEELLADLEQERRHLLAQKRRQRGNAEVIEDRIQELKVARDRLRAEERMQNIFGADHDLDAVEVEGRYASDEVHDANSKHESVEDDGRLVDLGYEAEGEDELKQWIENAGDAGWDAGRRMADRQSPEPAQRRYREKRTRENLQYGDEDREEETIVIGRDVRR